LPPAGAQRAAYGQPRPAGRTPCRDGAVLSFEDPAVDEVLPPQHQARLDRAARAVVLLFGQRVLGENLGGVVSVGLFVGVDTRSSRDPAKARVACS